MSNHYVSLNRGEEGSLMSDFTTGTSSTTTDLFELRITDGVTPTRVEVIKALEAFERFFSNPQQVGASGFDVTG
jgi:hypothetical protein